MFYMKISQIIFRNLGFSNVFFLKHGKNTSIISSDTEAVCSRLCFSICLNVGQHVEVC